MRVFCRLMKRNSRQIRKKGRHTALDKRNYGIDLLRLVSMYMIVVLHVIGQGGVMVRITARPAAYYMVWLPEAAAMCAVNCYGLISGYVGVNARFKPSRQVSLWLTVEFYTLLITLVFGIIHPVWITRQVLLKSFFPVMWKTYWYFSAYMALSFLAPFFNRMLHSLSGKECRRLLVTVFLVFSVWTLIPKSFDVDFLSLSGGYTFVWIMVLYIFGGAMRLADLKEIKKRYLLLVYVLMTVIAWGSKILIENTTRRIYGKAMYGRGLVTYHAPTIFMCGICLVLLFSQLKINGRIARGIITALSPLAFAVYIIHTHPVIWEHILKGAFSKWIYLDWKVILGPVFLAALGIFALCLAIEFLRRQLFALLRIPQLTERIFGRFADRREDGKHRGS